MSLHLLFEYGDLSELVGDAVIKTNRETLHSKGRDIVSAVLYHLIATTPISRAEKIIIYGQDGKLLQIMAYGRPN